MTKSIRTSRLKIGYLERGPVDGPVVVLVHGFPDDALTWDSVTAPLADRGVRTLAPYLRGFGSTHFLDEGANRTGQLSALTRDLVEFLEALGIERCLLVGHDWGGRAVYGAAVLAPQRVAGLLALSVGYGTSHPGQAAISNEQVRAYWYQWYFATARGEATLSDDRHAFCKLLWRTWAPSWNFADAEFDATAASFENPDFVAIALHSYRHRWGFAASDSDYAADEAALAAIPPVTVPAVVLHGDQDGATLRETVAGRERFFTAGYRFNSIAGAGHFIQREQPQVVVDEILAVTGDLAR